MERELRNYMEIFVKEALDKVIVNMNICKCDKCRYDMMAIALNNLPPKYYVTEKGNLFAKLSLLQQQSDVDIIATIVKAANIVGSNPKHE